MSSPATFNFHNAPLSSIYWPIGAVSVYLVLVFLLVQIMETRKKSNNNKSNPFITSPKILVVHNLILSFWSLIMFLGCLTEIYHRWSSSSTTTTLQQQQEDGSSASYRWIFCEEELPLMTSSTGSLYFWSYVYYISKYYELFDTLLGLLSGSRMPNFKLQVYHHLVVIFMAWAWCEVAQSLQFIGLLFNTLVHIIMYLYFATRAGKCNFGIYLKIIKLTITRLQIIQFVMSFCCIFISIKMQYERTDGLYCSGFGRDSYYSLWGNAVFNATLLFSFINVFQTNKSKKEHKQ